MIIINYFNEEIKQIKERFYNRTKHPYILKFLEAPVLDEDRLFLLYTMLEEKKLKKDRLGDYVVTTLLVQAALDTHEIVSTQQVSTDDTKKERQLTVLAGDYYSSLYYFLLAKVNDITMIRLLANSIQEINESKMSFYKQNHNSLNQSLLDIKTIESSLLQKIAEHFKLPIWKAIASEFFFFKRLITERAKLLKGHKVPLIEAIINNGKSSNINNILGETRIQECLDVCDEYIFDTKIQLEKLCKHPSPLSSFIISRIDQILHETGLVKEKVAEEG